MSDELAQAAFDGDVVAVGRILDAGADIDGEGRSWNPLHAAIENSNVACVELLIRRGADVECCAGSGLSPLAHAVDIAIDGTQQTGGNPGDEPTEIIKLLLDAGADPMSGLGTARDHGSSKIIELLTSAGTLSGR